MKENIIYDGLLMSIEESIKAQGHLLIVGTAGSGKTTVLCSFLAEMSNRYTPEELGLYVIGRTEELTMLGGDPHLLSPIVNITEYEAVQNILLTVENMMAERYDSYSKAAEGKKTTKEIIVVIDGLENAVGGASEDSLLRLLHFSRLAGIYLLMTTQSPVLLAGIVNVNLENRLTLSRNASGEDCNGKH